MSFNQYSLPLLAFVGGVFLAVQGGFNARLGVLLEHPMLASISAFLSSLVFAVLFVLAVGVTLPTVKDLGAIPPYLYVAGGMCSVIGIGLYFYTIPKLGISTMISLGLCGQLVFSVVAGHFGWFDLPAEPITFKRLIGVSAMIIGILLLNSK